MIDKALTVALLVQVGAEGGVGGDALFVQVAQGFAVEAQNVAQHAPEARRQQVAPLGKQAVEVVAVVFGARLRIAHREAHLGGLRGHAQLIQQADEVGVGPVVEHNKTGVDGKAFALHFNVNRMAVAAHPVTGLKHSDVVLAVEQIGAGQAGNTAADDGYFHEDSSVSGRAMRLPRANCRR